MKAVNFYNFSTKDFSYTWDGEVFDFPAGETVKLQEYLALHFAKHLVDRELNDAKVATNHFSRRELERKALPGYVFEGETGTSVEKVSEAKLVFNMMNENAPKTEEEAVETGSTEPESAPKRGRKPKVEKEPKEEEFADLNK